MATKVLCLNICHIFTNLTGCRQLNIFLATLHKALGPWSKWEVQFMPFQELFPQWGKMQINLSARHDSAGIGFHPGSFLVSWVSLLKRKGLNRQGVAGHILWNQLLRWSVGGGRSAQRDTASIRVGLHLLCPPASAVPGDTGQEGKRRSWV